MIVRGLLFVVPLLCSAASRAAEPAGNQGAEVKTDAPGEERPTSRPRAFDVAFDGRVRLGFTTITPNRFFSIPTGSSEASRRNPDVGRFDGFALSDARLNLRATYGDDLYVRLGFDGAIVSYDGVDDPIGQHSTGLKDAYMRYTFHRKLQIYAGRFKPPFDVEELTATEDQFFVHRSLESRGVMRHEGFSGDMQGLAPGRQLGVMLGGDALFELGRAAVGYALAVTNGNAGEASLNDNDLPAVFGRIQLAWNTEQRTRSDEEGPATYAVQSGGLVGISGFFNEATFGQGRDRTRDRITGAGLDFLATISVITLQGQLLWARTEHVMLTGSEIEHALGGHAQIAVRVLDTGFSPAYRFAVLNPRWVPEDGVLSDIENYDQVAHHSLGLRYVPHELPVVILADYTHSAEQPGRSLPNDRFEAAVQVTF